MFLSAIIRVHKTICDTSVREIRIASGELEGARAMPSPRVPVQLAIVLSQVTSQPIVLKCSGSQHHSNSKQHAEIPSTSRSWRREGERSSVHQGQEPLRILLLQHLNITIKTCTSMRTYWIVMYMYKVITELELS